MMSREEVLGRYRRLREVGRRHHSGAIQFLARTAILEHARRLGLAAGRTVMADSEEELTLVFDLAIYTAKEGRTRAIDRYAKTAQLSCGTDESLMLNAMRNARFSIWRVERRHDTAGLIVTDVLRQTDVWLVDEGLEASAQDGLCFASRLYDVDNFAVTSGVVVPVDRDIVEDALADPLSCRHSDPERVGDDPRFAAAIYRAAIDDGIMERVAFN
ncbi:MAG: hypothetical protein ABI369_08890 [Acetobacteraceae bacterium]